MNELKINEFILNIHNVNLSTWPLLMCSTVRQLNTLLLGKFLETWNKSGTKVIKKYLLWTKNKKVQFNKD